VNPRKDYREMLGDKGADVPFGLKCSALKAVRPAEMVLIYFASDEGCLETNATCWGPVLLVLYLL
jgi:hypothetical protein